MELTKYWDDMQATDMYVLWNENDTVAEGNMGWAVRIAQHYNLDLPTGYEKADV